MQIATVLSIDQDSIPSRPGFTLEPLGRRNYRITLWGSFLPGWIGSLTGRLADRGHNITGGSARKVTPAVWHAVFEFEAMAGVEVAKINFLDLADSSLDRTPPKAIRLEDYRVVANQDGCISVHISGCDQLGLLGSLLKKFHLYMLFPNEVTVATTAGQVTDFFRLRGMGGVSPSREAITALDGALRSMVHGAGGGCCKLLIAGNAGTVCLMPKAAEDAALAVPVAMPIHSAADTSLLTRHFTPTTII